MKKRRKSVQSPLSTSIIYTPNQINNICTFDAFKTFVVAQLR